MMMGEIEEDPRRLTLPGTGSLRRIKKRFGRRSDQTLQALGLELILRLKGL